MGGCCCCCASKGAELNAAQPFYHDMRASEEHQPLSSHHVAVSALSTGILVDTNLDTSIPDTGRPVPVPCETYVGSPRTPSDNRTSLGDKNDGVQTTSKSVEETNSGSIQETIAKDMKSDGNEPKNIELAAAKEAKDDLEKSDDLKKQRETIVTSLLEEEDVCPTCFEEYDVENPKIITKCEHHFHLACILEWMERSDTCPVCDQEMIFTTANKS